MNTETLEKQLVAMTNDIADLKSAIASLKIDHHMMIRSNPKIQPGVASKVAYDSNGLVLKGSQLEQSDVPSLQINKIIGLQQALDDKMSSKDVREMIKSNINKQKTSKAIATGIKINYDENGQVVSSSGLIQDDIPNLSLDKIIGLKERLDLLDTYHQNVSSNDNSPSTISAHNDDTRSTQNIRELSMNQIPHELISKLNLIENKIPDLVSQRTFNATVKTLDGKLNANTTPVATGTYTKVKVDENGLVTEGSSLTINDLPELSINDISSLRETLAKKIDDRQFIELSNTVSTLVSSMNRIGEVTGIRSVIESKASDADLKELAIKVTKIERLFSEIIAKIPSELILTQVDLLSKELSNISGRLSVIENKLNINI